MEFFTVEEVSKILKLSIDTTRKLVRRPDFPSVKIGHVYRIPVAAFEKWVEKCPGKKYSL